MVHRKYVFSLFLFMNTSLCFAQSNTLFKNPIRFYNTDILNYIQILYKNEKYEKIIPFLCGPKVENLSKPKLINLLQNSKFGYKIKRVGIKVIDMTNWSVSYQRTLLGTNEIIRVKCSLIKDTCRLYVDEETWKNIFDRKMNLD